MMPQNFKHGETRDSCIGIFPLILHEHVFWVYLGLCTFWGQNYVKMELSKLSSVFKT